MHLYARSAPPRPTSCSPTTACNQLVGRFKNTLLRHGVELAMSVPVVLTAAQLTPLPQTQADPIRLDVGGGFLSIWLEIEADPELALAEPSADTMMPAEGDAMLF